MKYLGVDFGTKNIGIAMSDDLGQIAFPKIVIKNSPDTLDEIVKIAESEGAEGIVLGESRDQSGNLNKIHEAAASLGQDLSQKGFQVFFEKEFWTSFEAHTRQGKESMNARKQKVKATENLDAKAASLILQRYLDRQNRQIK